jgi:hypothetical protein
VSEENPLAGFYVIPIDKLKTNSIIMTDFQSYINTLPSDQRSWIGPTDDYEDSDGRHAIKFDIALDGTDWAHVLIYGASNRRIKAVKYIDAHYRD